VPKQGNPAWELFSRKLGSEGGTDFDANAPFWSGPFFLFQNGLIGGKRLLLFKTSWKSKAIFYFIESEILKFSFPKSNFGKMRFDLRGQNN